MLLFPRYSVKPMRNNYLSKSIGRNMSGEDSSTGRKNSSKAFSFGKKPSDVMHNQKYTCNLQNRAEKTYAQGGRKKQSANIYKKSSKSNNDPGINKSSSKHSIKCSGTNSKIKLRKNNGFFDPSEQHSSRRTEGKHFN